MPAVAGVRGTGDWGTDERPKNFREYIMWRSPNGNTPLFALMGKVGADSVDDPEFSWWDEPQTIIRLQANGAHASTDTLINVDSTDTAGTTWGVAKHLAPGDILMVEAAEASFGTTEYIKVLQIVSDTQFTAIRGYAGSTAATIADDAWMLKTGSAFPEGSAAPKATSRNPVKYSNYTQIFKTTYDVTNTAAETRARTGDVIKNDKKRRAFDHSRDIELALLFGRKSELVGDNGKPERTMDGLRRFIPSANINVALDSTAANAILTFLDAVYKVFDWDTGAGDERVFLCGNQFLNFMNKMVQRDSNSEIFFDDQITMYGMNLRKVVLPQGTIYLKTHPLMNVHALYAKAAFCVDFSAIRWRYLKNRDTKFKDNIQADDEDATKGQWLTEGGLEVRAGGLTQGYFAFTA